MDIATATGTIFGALVLAFVVETVLEYVVGIWWKPLANEARAKLMMGCGLACGVALALSFHVDLLAELGFAPSLAGQVISGLVIGRGSDYLHGFWKKVAGKK